MEYLDTYDEKGNFTGKFPRNEVHEKALWHKTIHCWLYDKAGYIYFQIRKEEQKMYTTASGHVTAGEDVKEAFGREIKEEIGIDVDYQAATPVDVVIFKMDREKSDGSVFRDRVFANVYVAEFDGNIEAFDFDPEELNGLVKVRATDVLDLFNGLVETIPAEKIVSQGKENVSHTCHIDIHEFLVNPHETLVGKYGDILKKVVEITSSIKETI